MKKDIQKKMRFSYLKVLCFLLLLFTTANYFYVDSRSIITQSINFWRALFQGDLLSYYSIYGSAWGIIEVFIMSIWKLPFYLIETVFQINIYDSLILRTLAKCDLIIYVYLCGKVIKKILKEYQVSDEKQEYANIMFISSSLIYTSCCICGQVDIIGLFFSLLAFLYLVRDQEKKFIFFLFLAIQCKYFPLFIFIPVILYRYKKLHKALMIIILPILVGSIINLPFSMYEKAHAIENNTAVVEEVAVEQVAESSDNAGMVEDTVGEVIESESPENVDIANNTGVVLGSGSSNNGVMNNRIFKMTDNKMVILGNEIPVLFLVYAVVCLFAFLLKYREEDCKKWYCYLAFCAMSLFLISYDSHLYRMLYILPFYIILLLTKKEAAKNDFILETICVSAFTLGNIFKYYWCSDFFITRGGIIDLIIPERKFALRGSEYYYRILSSESAFSIWMLLYVAFIIWIVYMIISNFPSERFQTFIHEKLHAEPIKMEKYLAIRMVVSFLVANFIFVIYAIHIVENIISKI